LVLEPERERERLRQKRALGVREMQQYERMREREYEMKEKLKEQPCLLCMVCQDENQSLQLSCCCEELPKKAGNILFEAHSSYAQC
jgi:hypothetical protein